MNDHRKTKSQLIRELRQYRKQHQSTHNRIRHFDALERISRASLKAETMKEMLEEVLEEVLSLFSCDRAWLFYPCDPKASSWHVPMEQTRPEWPGAHILGTDFPMTPDISEIIKAVLSLSGPVCFDPQSGRPMPGYATQAFCIQSQMLLALYPKVGKPWILGLHHCAKAHVFSNEEIQVFNEVGLRISDALSSSIYLKHMRLSEHKYRSLFEHMAQGVMYHDAAGRITSANPAAERILGLSFKEMEGRSCSDPSWDVICENGSVLPGEARPPLIALKTGKPVHNVVMGVLNPKEGAYRWICVDAMPQFHPGEKRPHGVFTTCNDITERKKAEEKQKMSVAVFQNTAEAVLISNAADLIIAANKAFSDMTGYTEREVEKQSVRLLRPDPHDRDFYTVIETSLKEVGRWQGEIQIRRKNGEVFPAWLTKSRVCNESGRLINYVSLFSDISSLKRSQAQLDFLAFHDPLTHLPNRLLFNDRLEHAIKRAQREGHQIALFFLDLDRFKLINDSLGHPTGDLLIQKVAKRIQCLVRKGDTVARLSGDEFMIILDKVDGIQAGKVFAHKLMSTFISPFVLNEREFRITVSMGISLYPQDGQDNDTLVKNADVAMYQAKEEGRNNYAFYTPALTTAVSKRLTLESDLHTALKKKQLVLYYQPQYSLKTGALTGAEALIRWQHPGRGLLLPAQFIPYAEESDLIISLGEWVLKTACRQMGQWQNQGHFVKRVAVNISGVQFLRGELVKTVKNVLKRSALDPEQLELEITESFLMKNTTWAVKSLKALKKLGVSIAIDDFGTGYSSLSYLKQLPIDKLKIDQSFIRDIPDDLHDKAIARAVLALAHGLDHQVIAEGVETKVQQSYLQSLDCDESQGFLYSPAVSAEAFTAFL